MQVSLETPRVTCMHKCYGFFWVMHYHSGTTGGWGRQSVSGFDQDITRHLSTLSKLVLPKVLAMVREYLHSESEQCWAAVHALQRWKI